MQRVAWRYGYFMREEPIVEAVVEYRCGYTNTSPEELPATLTTLQDGAIDFNVCDFHNLADVLINVSAHLKDRELFPIHHERWPFATIIFGNREASD